MSNKKTHAAIIKELTASLHKVDFCKLTQPFHVGKQYPKGTLVIFSTSALDEYNAYSDVVVLDPSIKGSLDMAGTTEPYTKVDNKASKEATKS